MKQLTAADIDKTDPRKLAEALRTYCNKAINCDAFMDPPGVVPRFATALLAVLDACPVIMVVDESEHWVKPGDFGYYREERQVQSRSDIVKKAARAWLQAGGTLEVEGQ